MNLLDLDMDTVDAIAVAGGPGSLPGCAWSRHRQGLGLALKKPLVHVPTVDAMAYNMWGAEGLICPIMDAKTQPGLIRGYTILWDGLEVVMSSSLWI